MSAERYCHGGCSEWHPGCQVHRKPLHVPEGQRIYEAQIQQRQQAQDMATVMVTVEMIREMIRQEMAKFGAQNQPKINGDHKIAIDAHSEHLDNLDQAVDYLESRLNAKPSLSEERVLELLRGELLKRESGEKLHSALIEANKQLSANNMNVIQCPCYSCQKMLQKYKDKSW